MAYKELHRVKGVPEYMEDLLIARVALGYSPIGNGNLNNGTYFSEPCVPYESRSIPYNPANVEYGKWELQVPLQAEKSIIAPFPQYNLLGGGIQYQFRTPQNGFYKASELIKRGWIRKL